VVAVIKLHAAVAAWKWLRSNPCGCVLYTEVNRYAEETFKGREMQYPFALPPLCRIADAPFNSTLAFLSSRSESV
jgi:hypothetical protein